VLWARGPTWTAAVGGVGGVEGVLDNRVEGLADGGGRQVGNRGRKLVLGRGLYIRRLVGVVGVVGVVVLVDGRQRRAATERSATRCRGRRERRCSSSCASASAGASRHSGECCAKVGMGKVRGRTRGALQRIGVGRLVQVCDWRMAVSFGQPSRRRLFLHSAGTPRRDGGLAATRSHVTLDT